MATLTIKNIPEALYRELKDQAIRHRRSINSEVIMNLEQAVKLHRTNVEIVLTEARRLRDKSSHYHLTGYTFKTVKNKGRA